MPLPQLRTEGIDITNTLARIDAMKTSNLQREGLKQQNALRAIQLTPEAQESRAKSAKLDFETKNMVLQNEHLKSQQLKYKTINEGIKHAADQVLAGDDGTAYVKNREYIIKEIGLPEHMLPSIDFFMDDKTDIRQPGLDQTVKKFNKDRFIKWANRSALTVAEITTASEERKKDFKMTPIFNLNGEQSFVVIDQTKPAKAEDFGPGMSFSKPTDSKNPKVKTTYQTKDGEIINLMDDGKFYNASGKEVKGNKVKNLTVVGTRAEGVLTPAQKQTKETQNRKRLTALTKDITKIEKDGSTLLLDKDAGADAVAEYNAIAKETGGKYRYEWREGAIEVEESLTNKALEFFGLSEDQSMTDGYVKVPVEEFGKPQIETKEIKPKEVKKPTTMDEKLLNQYKRKYPNRTEEEIIKAYNKQI